MGIRLLVVFAILVTWVHCEDTELPAGGVVYGTRYPYAPATCPAITCARRGNSNPSCNATVLCPWGDFCYVPYESKSTTGSCFTLPGPGELCAWIGFYARCTTSCTGSDFCDNPLREPGDYCTANPYSFTRSCIEGPLTGCDSNRRCPAAFLGDVCPSFPKGCSNSFCHKETLRCTAYSRLGESCGSNGQKCLEWLTCDENQTCSFSHKEWFLPNVQEGGDCSQAICDAGLYCGTDKVCHEKSKGSGAVCLTNKDCADGQYCACDSKTGSGVCHSYEVTSEYLDSIKTFKAFTECWELNDCNKKLYADECKVGACHEAFCAMLGNATSGAEFALDLQPNCMTDPFTQIIGTKSFAFQTYCASTVPYPPQPSVAPTTAPVAPTVAPTTTPAPEPAHPSLRPSAAVSIASMMQLWKLCVCVLIAFL